MSENQNPHSNKKFIISIILIILLFIVIGIDMGLIIFSQPYHLTYIDKYSNIKDPSYEIVSPRAEDLQECQINIENYPCGYELGAAMIAFNAFDSSIGYEDIYDFMTENYGWADKEINAEKYEGRMRPDVVSGIIQNYAFVKGLNIYVISSFEEMDLDKLKNLIQDGYLVQAWYLLNNNTNIENKWQYSKIGIIYKVDSDRIYLIDVDDNYVDYDITEFFDAWKACQEWAILYK